MRAADECMLLFAALMLCLYDVLNHYRETDSDMNNPPPSQMPGIIAFSAPHRENHANRIEHLYKNWLWFILFIGKKSCNGYRKRIMFLESYVLRMSPVRNDILQYFFFHKHEHNKQEGCYFLVCIMGTCRDQVFPFLLFLFLTTKEKIMLVLWWW